MGDSELKRKEDFQEEELGGSSEETVREDNDVVYPSPHNRSKRLRLRFDDHVPFIKSSGIETWPKQPPQNLYETISRVQSPPAQRSFIRREDHSENRQWLAFTSRCSNRLNENSFANLNSRKRNFSSSKSGQNEIRSSVSDTFSTWKCTSCWVRNPKKENRCLACETLHPNVDKTTALMFKSIDKPTMTSSVCPTTTRSTTTSSILNVNTSMSTSSVNVGGFAYKNEATGSVLLPITQSTPTGCAASTTVPVSSRVFVFGAEKNSSSPFIYGSGHYKPQTTSSVPSLVAHSAAEELNVPNSTRNCSGGFVFEIPKTEGRISTATPFTFTSGASSNISGFSGFQPHQAAKPTFKFGSQSAGSTAPTIGMSSNFSFAKSEASYQIPSSVSQNPVSAFGPTNTNFAFGSKTNTSNQITRIVSQAPGTAFGTTMNSESSAIQSMFGSSTHVQSFSRTYKPGGIDFEGATSSVFQLYASNNTEKRPTAAASGFFRTPPAIETNSNFPSGFNMSTPPIFNFGATSTPATGPFQLASVSQNPFSAFGPTNTNCAFGYQNDTSNQCHSTMSQAPGIAFGSTTNSTFNGNYEGNFTSQAHAPLFGSSAIQSAFRSSSSVQSFGGIGQSGGGRFNFAGATFSVLQFYASNNKEKKRTATASGFLGTPSARQTNNTFPTDLSMSTPPIFNSGATSTPTAGPFLLAGSTAPQPSIPSTATRKILIARRMNT